MTPRQLGALFLLGALWGGSFLFIRVAVPALGPFVLVGLRVGIAALALTAVALASGRAGKLRLWWRPFLFMGFVNTATPFVLISAAEAHLTASLAAILNSTTVLFTALVAAAWLGDTLTARKLAGVFVGIFGVVALVGWDPLPLNGAVLLSAAAVLGASVCYAVGGVYAKKTFEGVPLVTVAAGQQIAATAVMLPAVAVTLPDEAPSTTVALCVLALALLSTAVAYMLYFYLLANTGPTATSTVTLLVPVFGLLFGVSLLGEPVSIGTFVGLAAVLSSVALVTGLRPTAKT